MQVFFSVILGDNWKVLCKTKKWIREKEVVLKHVDTGNYLSADERHRYQQIISGLIYVTVLLGQIEVSCSSRSSTNEKWSAQEGIYVTSETSEKENATDSGHEKDEL